ncbi:ER lumen protein-retaining receptor B [Balamuthia mandrillaris]
MNIFRLSGDLLHLLSFLLLLWKIRSQKSCAGISFKTQALYALVFTTRYLDLFFNFNSLYNSVMKIIFLASTYYILYMMKYDFKHTYDKEHDSFRVLFLIVPCFILALFFNFEFSIVEILWAFSVYLEAVAIMPQLFLLQRTGEVETLTSDYIFALGGYRALYLFNWIYRLLTEEGYQNWIVWIAGLVQTVLYIDFFYYYIISKWYGRKFVLPQ